MLKGDDRLPRYQRLADELRDKVIKGSWRPGDRVPSENELAEEYKIAPGTARQAVAQLVGEEILERLHGKGTFVRRPSFDRSLFRFFRFRTDSGETSIPESRILRRTLEPAPGYVIRKLNLPEGSDAIALTRVRLIDGKPVLLEQIWLPTSPFQPILEMPDSEFGPLLYPIYDRECGALVARAEEDLTAEAARPETARILRLEEGDPLIVIDRLAFGYDDQPLEWRRSRGRADQFSYHTEIR
ncbi:MAG: GntR family transcriptional regulator [Sneathiella sp.]